MDDTTVEPLPIETTLPPSPIEDSSAGPAINLLPPEESTGGGINLKPEQHAPELTAKGILSRASMAHYALQEKSPGTPQLEGVIQQGREGDLRSTASFDQKIKQNTAAMQMIKQFTQDGTKPLSKEEETAVMGIAQSMQDPDPNTILERMWSHNYVKELVTTRSKLVEDALTTVPIPTLGIAGHADDVISTRQSINSIKEGFDKRYADMPNFSFNPSKQSKTDAWITSFIPAYNNVVKHQSVEGMSSDLLPGNNMAEFKDYVYLLGPDKGTKLVKEWAERNWQYSPHAVMDMLDSMVQMPDDKKFVDNLMGIADVATAIPGGLLARGASAEANAVSRVMKNSPVKITEEFAKANEHILFDAKQIQTLLEKGTLEYKGVGTATTPRAMASYELRKAAEAFPEEGGYPPSSDFYSHSAGSVGPPRAHLEEGRNMSPREIQTAQEGTPGYRLSPTFNVDAFREANVNVRLAQKKLDDARFALDDITKAGDEASIASQKARINQLDDELNTAKEARSATTYMDKHPALARAEAGIRSYMSSGIRSLKTLPTETGERAVDLQGSLTTLGRMDEAIQTGAIRKTIENINPEPPTIGSEMVSFGKDIPTFMRPNPFVDNSSALSREGAMRISEELSRNGELLKEAASGQRVQRTTKEDIIGLAEQAKATVLQKYSTDFNNSVIDQQRVYNPLENLNYIQTKLGKTDATGFADETSARNTMTQVYGVPPQDVVITQEGNIFYGNVLTPVNETGVRNTTIPTNNKTPDYWGGFGLRYIRSAADTLSDLHNQARYTATHTPQRINQVVKSIVKGIDKLDNEGFEQLGQMLKQSELDFDAGGNKGVWYSVKQLEEEYGKRFAKTPSEDFVQAYYTYKQLMDFDYELRKNYVQTSIKRWGGESIKFKLPDGTDSPEFFGRTVEKIDQSKLRNRGVLLVEDKEMKQVWTNDVKIDTELSGKIADLIENQGYEIHQLWEPLKKPLKDVHGGDIYYVVTNTANKRNIDPKDVLPYRGGPHVAYTHPHFIGQPIIATDGKGQPIYSGDQIFRSGGSTEVGARSWATKYDTARQLMNGGDDTVLSDYLRVNLPEGIDDFKKLFTGPNGLNRDQPIAYHSSGNNIFQNNPELFDAAGYNGQVYKYDLIKEYMNDMANPAASLNSGFLQERANQALQVPKDMGFDIPNRFKLDNAATLDPYISLNRSLKQANRVHFMEDYKVMAAESFVTEYGRHLENVSTEALKRNPLHYLYEGTIDSGTPDSIRRQMETFRDHVKSFIGMQSELGTELTGYEAKMQNTLYKVLGENKTTSLLENTFVSNYLIPAIKDPAAYARAWAFKSRMGIFNPIQYIQQGQAFVQAVAISPIAGVDGVKTASWLHAGGRFALDDPAKFDYYASKIAKSTSMSVDDAKEMLQGYKDSGIGIIGQETAWNNSFSDPKIFQGNVGKFLDKGDVFFNAGEGFQRDVGYFTAFKEWKNANPGRVADQYDLGDIMRRAQDMTSNMTRAANSALQNNSFASIPMQFQTFRIRQMELLLGNRLSLAEKGRLLFTNSLLYGVPTAVSGAMLKNYYDDIKQAAADKGYNLNDGYLEALHGGVLQWMIHATTGKQLDIPTAYGPGASNWWGNVKDAWMGNDGAKSLGELFGGPAGGNIQDFGFATAPVMRWAYGKLSGNEYPLTTEDFLRFSALTTTTDSARKAWQAYNTGKYYSKRGQEIGDVTTWDGLLMAGFGLSPQQFQDSFAKARSDKQIKGWQEDALKEARNELQLASEAMLKGEQGNYQEHFKKAQYIFESNDITHEKRMETFLSATKNNNLYERMNSLFYKDPRQSQQDKQFNKIIEQGKKQ